MAAEDRLDVGEATFTLRRHPDRANSSLRAWDAADLLLLNAVGHHDDAKRLLLVGDSQGTLATVLAPRQRTSLLDRSASRLATAANLERNSMNQAGLTMLGDLGDAPSDHDLVLMKLPRANDLLELQLRRLAMLAPAGTPVLAGVMATRMSSGAIKLFERLLGPVEVSRAVRKARVLRSAVGPKQCQAEPRSFAGPEGLALVSWPSVFGAGKVDMGAAALLPHIPAATGPLDIVDLGCGGGLLGLVAALRCPTARLTFVDDSALAISSSELSWQANAARLGRRPARFLHGDDLAALANRSVDLVLCNPPFHQEHAQTRQAGAAMFAEARRVLRPGGALWVVGNRHLGYDQGMKRRFRQVRVVWSDRRFMVIRAEGRL